MKSQCFFSIGCISAKRKDNYLQANKDEEFQLKQRIQSIKMRLKLVNEQIKEFKEILDSLIAIHKLLDEESKAKYINFAKVVENKYNTLRTVMPGKGLYLTCT